MAYETLSGFAVAAAAVGTQAQWDATDKVIPSGFICYANDSGTIKIGNGTDTYANLNSYTVNMNDIAGLSAALANKAAYNQVGVFTKAQRADVIAITGSTPYVIDLNAGNVFSLSASTAVTIDAPTNVTAGQTGSIYVTITGSGTLAFNSVWKKLGTGSYTWSTGIHLVTYEVVANDAIAYNIGKVT